MNSECIFCKIVNQEIPSTVIFENEDFVLKVHFWGGLFYTEDFFFY